MPIDPLIDSLLDMYNGKSFMVSFKPTQVVSWLEHLNFQNLNV